MITRLLCVAAVLFAFGGDARSQAADGPNEYRTLPDKFDPSRDAAKDIQDAIALARESGKRVILDVGGNWCIWCRRLDSLFVKHKDLDEFMQSKFVVVRVNWSPENRNTEVLSHYPKVAGYPHLFVLDEKGKLLHSQDTSELESGKGHDPEKVMAFLKRWSATSVRARWSAHAGNALR